MELAKIILEYWKVILSGSVISGVVAITFFFLFKEDIKALLLRVAKIRFPGGEVDTPQSTRLASEGANEKTSPDPKNLPPVEGLPQGLNPQQKQTVEYLLRSHIVIACLWEYRYLNFYLVRSTQMILDWLILLKQPIVLKHYDAHWLTIIPSADERQAIISALRTHRLVKIDDNGLIKVTPKGHEYREWRGPSYPPKRKEQ